MSVVVPRASKAAMTDVYEDHAPLVRAIARRFAYRYRRDFEETFADANRFYLEAYHTFNPEYGTIVEQRIQYAIWQRLYDQMREDARDAELLTRTDADVSRLAARVNPPVFDRDKLESELGDNARVVLALILDTPRDLLNAFRTDRKPGPESMRKWLKKHLKYSLGWATSTIIETFDEIREVLE